MSLWTALRGLFGGGSGYAVVWREHTTEGVVMKGDLIPGKSDPDAISLVRAKFMHVGPDWAFWALFRSNDTLVTAEQGPRISKWPGEFAHVASDSHVRSTLEAIRRKKTAVARPLHKVKLQSRGPKSAPGAG